MQRVKIKYLPVPGNLRGNGPSHGWFIFLPGDTDTTPAAATADYEEAIRYAYHAWRWMHRANIHYSDARH